MIVKKKGTLLETLLAAGSEMENEGLRCFAEYYVRDSSLEEVREVIKQTLALAAWASITKCCATAFFIAEGGKRYPELEWEAVKGLEFLSKNKMIEVRSAVIDACACVLMGVMSRDLVVQMKDDSAKDLSAYGAKDVHEAAEFVLLVWDYVDPWEGEED